MKDKENWVDRNFWWLLAIGCGYFALHLIAWIAR